MLTGAGKSICYQIPAMLLPGIHAGYINSSLTNVQISRVYAKAMEGAYKILYVAPERLESHEFADFTERIIISMVTVDKAHCISHVQGEKASHRNVFCCFPRRIL